MNIKNNQIKEHKTQPILVDKSTSPNDILISGNSFESGNSLRETLSVENREKVQGICCAISESDSAATD